MMAALDVGKSREDCESCPHVIATPAACEKRPKEEEFPEAGWPRWF